MDRIDKVGDVLRHASPRRTICEVLREINDLARGRRDIEAKVIEAIAMAKRMDEKLREYRANWSAGVYEHNEDKKDDLRRRRA